MTASHTAQLQRPLCATCEKAHISEALLLEHSLENSLLAVPSGTHCVVCVFMNIYGLGLQITNKTPGECVKEQICLAPPQEVLSQ